VHVLVCFTVLHTGIPQHCAATAASSYNVTGGYQQKASCDTTSIAITKPPHSESQSRFGNNTCIVVVLDAVKPYDTHQLTESDF